MQEHPPKLWAHSDPKSTQMWHFKSLIEEKYKVQFADYEALRQWSIDNIADFWAEVWHYTRIRASEPFTKVTDHSI